MSMDLRIGIIADDKGAQQEFEKLSQSVDYSAKSVSTLRNELKKYNVSIVQGQNSLGRLVEGSKEYELALSSIKTGTSGFTDTVNKYLNAIDRQVLSFGSNAESLKAYKKEVASLEKELQNLISGGIGGGSWSGELQNLNALTTRLTSSQKKLNDAIKEQNRAKAVAQKEKSLTNFKGSLKTANSQNIDYLKAQVLGQTGSIAQMEYDALSSELSKIIAVEGVTSTKTIELANKMKTLEKTMKEASRTPLNERMSNLVKSFVSAQVVVWGIRKVFTSVINLIKESAQVASEAEETYNLFITTFENVSSAAIKTASTLASSFGMATSTAQKALGTFGDLVIGYGATDKEALAFGETAAKTALDIISYKNITGDMEQTFQSIASGLAGNVENFRKLGYVITQAEVKTKLQKKGLDRLTGSSLQYAQVQARLELLQEKAYKSQGDMIKTLDSTENITRRLNEATKEYKENLGKDVNKIFSPIKKWWLEILEATNKAAKAKENFLKTGDGGNVYDIRTNEDYSTILKNLTHNYRNNLGGIRFDDDKLFKYLSDIMLIFNATPEQMKEVMKDANIGDKKIDKVIDLLEDIYKTNEERKALEKKREELKSDKQSYAQSLMTTYDNLYSIMGASDKTYSTFMSSVNSLVNNETATISDMRKKAGAYFEALFRNNKDNEIHPYNFLSGEQSTWGLFFSDMKEEALTELQTALKDSFSDLNNFFITTSENGTLSDEQKELLDYIREVYKESIQEKENIQTTNKVLSVFDELANIFNGKLFSSLLNLITQTEAFSQLASIVSDSILPVLNAFLEPLLPMLELLGDLIQSTFLPVFEALYPVFKALAIVITWIIGMLNVLTGIIQDSVKWAVGWISKGFLDLVNGVIDILNKIPFVDISKVDTSWAEEWASTDIEGNANARYKKMQESIDKIQSYTMNIDKNTEKKDVDLSFLNSMKEKGLINASEYEALYRDAMGMSSLDRVETIKASEGNLIDYRTNARTTTISNGDIQIIINGADTDKESLAKEVIRQMKETFRNGNSSYSMVY